MLPGRFAPATGNFTLGLIAIALGPVVSAIVVRCSATIGAWNTSRPGDSPRHDMRYPSPSSWRYLTVLSVFSGTPE
jgi:hypothetical protein